MPNQLTFKDIEIGEKQARLKILSSELQRRLKATALTINRNEFAAVVDKAYTTVSGVLNTNDEKSENFPTHWTPALIILNRELFIKEVLDYLLAICDCEPAKKRSPKTIEEELSDLKQKIKQHNLEKIFEL